MLRLLAFLLLAAPAMAEVTVDEKALVGIWKMTYAPEAEDRADVTEPSSGYLVFLPGGKYLEFRNDCCGVAEVMREALPYRIEGAKVILSCKRASGEPYDRTLQHIAIDHVVFFDGIESKPVTTSTLRVGNGPNYGYGKVYP